MKLRFTRTALRQLDHVLAGVAAHSPQGARNVQKRMNEIVHLLLQHPHAGRATDRPGVRRIVTAPYPYLIMYRVGNGEIVIRTVRHAARRPLS